jgi:predicted kinase
MKTLVVITGHPGSGKSSIARELSDMFAIPYLSKDTLKEKMFDSLGTGDKEWSLKASAAAHRIMDEIVANHLAIGQSIIVESNFKAGIDSERFTAILSEHGANCLQILCEADGEVLFKRWVERIEQSQRHEGHVEKISLEQIKSDLAEPYEKLHIPGAFIRIATDDFSTVNAELEKLPLR